MKCTVCPSKFESSITDVKHLLGFGLETLEAGRTVDKWIQELRETPS